MARKVRIDRGARKMIRGRWHVWTGSRWSQYARYDVGGSGGRKAKKRTGRRSVFTKITTWLKGLPGGRPRRRTSRHKGAGTLNELHPNLYRRPAPRRGSGDAGARNVVPITHGKGRRKRRR